MPVAEEQARAGIARNIGYSASRPRQVGSDYRQAIAGRHLRYTALIVHVRECAIAIVPVPAFHRLLRRPGARSVQLLRQAPWDIELSPLQRPLRPACFHRRFQPFGVAAKWDHCEAQHSAQGQCAIVI